MKAAAATDPNIVTVAGKAVHLKGHLPLKVGHRLPAMLQACGDGDLNTVVKVLALVIESWDFDGDPSSPVTYEEMDVYTEIIPLAQQVVQRLTERLQADPKATASANGSS